MTPPGMVPQDASIASLKPLFLAWMGGAETMRPYSKHTVRGYSRAFDEFSSFCSKNTLYAPQDINHAWIRAYARETASRGLSGASINANISGVETFFAYCQYEGLIISNPVTDYRNEARALRRGGRAPKRIPPVLYTKEREKLMDLVYSRNHKNRGRDLAMLGLLLDSGVRTEELCSLTVAEGRTLVETGKMRIIGKGNKERAITPMLEYRSALEVYMNDQRGLPPTTPLFRSRNGMPMRQAGVHRTVSYYLGLAEISKPQRGGHLLRHTAASLMLASGVNIRLVQEFLGHASITTTERYLHLV